MSLALFVKAGGALERQVVGFSRAGGKYDVLRVCSNEVGNILESIVRLRCIVSCVGTDLAGSLDSFLSLPSIRVCSRVWVSVLVRHVRQHGVENARVNRCCRL